MEAIRWIRPIKVSPTQKVVLWALADRANEKGEAWPSIETLMEATCLSDRAIQKALMEMRKAGLLTAEPGGGRHRTTLYRLPLGAAIATETPNDVRGKEGGETPNVVHETPNVVRNTPNHVRETPNDVHPIPQYPSISQKEEKEEGALRASPTPRGTRLPKDWEPTIADCDFARSLSLDPRQVAPAFRDYWHAATGSKATKADWPATWRNWCRRDAERRPASRGAAQPQQQRRSVHDNIRWMFEPRGHSTAFDFDGQAEELPH